MDKIEFIDTDTAITLLAHWLKQDEEPDLVLTDLDPNRHIWLENIN